MTSFNGALVIRERNGRVFYEAKWRDSRGHQVKRRVGRAWLERDVHGTYAPGNVVLRPEILQAGQQALAAAYPDARFQYVFHGSSGSSERELADAVSFGVVKVNVDTDNQYAFTRALAGHVLDHWQGVLKVDAGIADKRSFDPRAWGSAGEAAMAERVRQACEQLGSAGRSLAASAGACDRAGPSLIDLD